MARRGGRRSIAALVLALVVTSSFVAASGTDAGAGSPPALRDLAEAQGLHLGAAVAGEPVLSDAQYREVLTREFSMGTSENHMKWGLIHPAEATYDFATADDQVALLEGAGMAVRGHNLAWHMQNPDWLTGGTWTREEAIALLEGHIDEVVGHYGGQIAEWDVVNEVVGLTGGAWENPWTGPIGFPDYLDVAFTRARVADPEALLVYNDFLIEQPGPRADAAHDLVTGMVGRGVPIDGVGFQAHLGVESCPTATSCLNGFLTQMLRYDALGLRVSVTELDVAIPLPADPGELDRQADVYRQVVLACLWAPNCDTVVLWGFTDAHSWIPGLRPGWGAALIFDEEYQAKPAYDAIAAVLAQPPVAPGCTGYATQDEAQAAFDAQIAGAPFLDPDGDGVACAQLPAAPVPAAASPGTATPAFTG